MQSVPLAIGQIEQDDQPPANHQSWTRKSQPLLVLPKIRRSQSTKGSLRNEAITSMVVNHESQLLANHGEEAKDDPSDKN